MAYKNPVPDVDRSKRFRLKPAFTFDDAITAEEAARGIYDLIIEKGEVPVSWVEFTDGYKETNRK